MLFNCIPRAAYYPTLAITSIRDATMAYRHVLLQRHNIQRTVGPLPVIRIRLRVGTYFGSHVSGHGK